MPGERQPQVRVPDGGGEGRLRQRTLRRAVFQIELGACRMDRKPQGGIDIAGKLLAGGE